MTAQPSDLYDLLNKIRYDTTAIQAKVTDALKILGELNLPRQAEAVCDHCGLRFRGPNTLAEHLHVSHDGPVPQHWLDAEARAHEPHDEPGLVPEPMDSGKTRAGEGDDEPEIGAAA